MKLSDFYDSLKLTEQLALENYTQRNSVLDCGLSGVCNHYFPKYDYHYNKIGEIVLTCKVAKTVKGQLRYTYQLNGKRIAKNQIDHEMLRLGAFRR